MNLSVTHANAIASSRARLLYVAPPFAALCYPFLLKGFHASVTSGDTARPLISALFLIVAVAVPALGIYVCAKLGAVAHPTVGEVRAKRIALLSVGAAPIYTAVGVLLAMVPGSFSDIVPWLLLWGIASVLAAEAASSRNAVPATSQGEISARLRVAHGVSAGIIVLIFLAMHLSNHLSGLWSVAEHRFLMAKFRLIYRAHFVEPVLVALFLFQVGSGTELVWRYVRRPSDFFRTLQIASGAYLVFFILGHMNSVFIYARTYLKIPTDWNFATGAPTGLIRDAWNIRLLPHYLLGVFFVLTHLVLGARVVALAHNRDRVTVDRLAVAGIVLAAVVAIATLTGMSGIHLG